MGFFREKLIYIKVWIQSDRAFPVKDHWDRKDFFFCSVLVQSLLWGGRVWTQSSQALLQIKYWYQKSLPATFQKL